MTAAGSKLLEVLGRFLRLGLTSFGGPVAHLGYFRTEFVERCKWLDDHAFAEIVAVCSALPGPTSSQVGIVIGARRAGPLGALAAWVGFTTPSAIVMTFLGVALRASADAAHGRPFPVLAGAFGGLIGAAGGVVAFAVVSLARTLARTLGTRTIALVAFAVALAADRVAPQLQWVPLLVGAAGGALALPKDAALPPATLGIRVPRAAAVCAALVLAILVVVLPIFATPSSPAALFAVFVRAGSLVFGGGHVVLPFLQTLISSHEVPAATFFAGYGAAQAVPGPLFTFAGFLGAVNATATHGVGGALLAIVGIFLPSFLLLAAVLPLWSFLRSLPRAGAVLAGINAAVVGLLAAVLVTPIGATLVAVPWELAVAVIAFVALSFLRATPLLVVVACAAVGAAYGGIAHSAL